MAHPRPDPHSGQRHTDVTRVDFAVASEKRRLRELARLQRSELDPQQRRAHDLARTRHLLAMVPSGAVLASYLSREDEPATTEAVAVLWRRGHRILVPSLSPATCPERALAGPAWAWYRGPSQLREGYHGIPESLGHALPPSALAEADIVVVSGLRGGRDGTRIGTGAGWFDRALEHARPEAQVWLLVNQDEVVDTLPQDSHDHLVHKVISEEGVTTTGER